MYPSRFRYEAPRSLDEAIALLRDGGGEAKVLAGGQSLIPLLKLRFAPAFTEDSVVIRAFIGITQAGKNLACLHDAHRVALAEAVG